MLTEWIRKIIGSVIRIDNSRHDNNYVKTDPTVDDIDRTSFYKTHKDAYPANGAWRYGTERTVGPDQVLVIRNINCSESLTGIDAASSFVLQLDVGGGWYTYGALTLASTAAGAPNQASYAQYNQGLLPITLFPGNKYRLYIAGSGDPVYTTITYQERYL